MFFSKLLILLNLLNPKSNNRKNNYFSRLILFKKLHVIKLQPTELQHIFELPTHLGEVVQRTIYYKNDFLTKII